MSANGKSTCKIVKTVDEVHMHIIELALSMGFSNAIECEITGMCCKKDGIEENVENEQVQAHNLMSCDVVYIQQEKTPKTEFHQLSANTKLTLCSNLQIPFLAKKLCSEGKKPDTARSPLQCKIVLGDGNCFFRALSVCLSGSEESHEILRSKMCTHVTQNKALFKGLLRSPSQSLEDYLMSMSCVGTWATEFEIIAMSHMLNVNIFTYSDCAWKKIFRQPCRQTILTNRWKYLS